MVDTWPGTWWTRVGNAQLTKSSFFVSSLFWVASGGCGRCGKREAFSKSCGKVRSSFPQDVSFHSPVPVAECTNGSVLRRCELATVNRRDGLMAEKDVPNPVFRGGSQRHRLTNECLPDVVLTAVKADASAAHHLSHHIIRVVDDRR